MNSWRQSALVSESYVTTLTPLLIACFSAVHSAPGSCADTAIAETCCCVSVLTYETCPAVSVALVVPTSLYVSPRAVSAVLPPVSEVVKYGLLTCFGRNATVRPVFVDAFGFADAPVPAAAEDAAASVEPLVAPPHAVSPSASSGATAAVAITRTATGRGRRKVRVMTVPFTGRMTTVSVSWSGWCVGRGRGPTAWPRAVRGRRRRAGSR